MQICRRSHRPYAALLAILCLTRFASAEDYLSPELRAQVEALKIAEHETPTNAKNVYERAPVAWKWINALGKRGEAFAPDLPLFLSFPLGLPDEPVMSLAVRAIGQTILEMQVKDETPDALGPFTVASTGPFEVDSYATIEQTYTIGSVPMQEGGGLALCHQLMADYGLYQTKDPDAPDYTTIRCSNPGAQFEARPWRLPNFVHGSHGTIAFTLKGTTLQPGDTITITYGDRSQGSPGYKMQSYEGDDFQLPVYVDLDGSRNYFAHHWPSMKIVGAAAADATATVPSVVGVGEKFDLAVRTRDRFYNRAAREIPAYTVSLNGKEIARTKPEDGGLSIVNDLRLDTPGVYRYTLQANDSDIELETNPIWVQENPETRIYWGETHGHTSYAEATGTVANYFRYGREDAQLDFLALSEHDAWMDDREWDTLVDAVDTYNVPNEFLVYLSFEWTAGMQYGGHHNILYRTAPDRKRVPVQEAGLLSELFEGLRRENDPTDILSIPHAHMPGDWRQSDPLMERLVEICSMHGTFEWFGNYYLQHGHQVGFVGASDNHEGRPGFSGKSSTGAFQHFGGLGAVMAPELTSDALFDAMRDIAAYATADAARIILDTDLNGIRMGKRQPYTPKRELRARVMGTAPLATLDVIKNGEVIHTKDFITAPLESECWVRLNFDSTSESGMRDTPRGNRVWKGNIQIEGATIEDIVVPGLKNPYVERATVDPNDPSQINFHTETRGKGNNILIKLSGANTATTLTLNLDPTREHGNTYPINYRPGSFPKETLSMTLADMTDSPWVHDFQTLRYIDTLSIGIINPDAPKDQEITFKDPTDPDHDDYYYIRVTQLDGAKAWSSPWWVGGIRPR